MGMEYYTEYSEEHDVNRICISIDEYDEPDHFELYGYDEE